MGNGEIAVVENQQPPTIIEQTDPAIIIEEATYIANQLADIIKQKKLYKKIGNKDHVYVEGWTTLGALSKIFPVLEHSERLDREDEIAYESRVVAQTIDGKVVGVGEALCSNKENNWRGQDEYAIKSMSQTRATSKALRMPLGWIMVLAGYNPTPAEEMDGISKFPNQGVVNGSKKPATSKRPAGRKPAPSKKPAKPAQTRASDEDAANDAIDAEYKVKEKPDEPKTLDMTGVDLETLMGINKNLDKWIRTCQEKNEPKTVKQVCSWCEDLLQDKKLTLEEFKQVRKALGHDVK
jgi:hypothetical protein